jgi:hypothetical protein
MDFTPALVLSVVTLIVTVGVAWGGMRAMVKTIATHMDKLSDEVRALALAQAQTSGQKDAIITIQGQVLDLSVRLARQEAKTD